MLELQSYAQIAPSVAHGVPRFGMALGHPRCVEGAVQNHCAWAIRHSGAFGAQIAHSQCRSP